MTRPPDAGSGAVWADCAPVYTARDQAVAAFALRGQLQNRTEAFLRDDAPVLRRIIGSVGDHACVIALDRAFSAMRASPGDWRRGVARSVGLAGEALRRTLDRMDADDPRRGVTRWNAERLRPLRTTAGDVVHASVLARFPSAGTHWRR